MYENLVTNLGTDYENMTQNALINRMRKQRIEEEDMQMRLAKEKEARMLERNALKAPYSESYDETVSIPGESADSVMDSIDAQTKAYMQSPEAQAALQQERNNLEQQGMIGQNSSQSEVKRSQLFADIARNMEQQKRQELWGALPADTGRNVDQTVTKTRQITPELAQAQTTGAILADQEAAALKLAKDEKALKMLQDRMTPFITSAKSQSDDSAKKMYESMAKAAEQQGIKSNNEAMIAYAESIRGLKDYENKAKEVVGKEHTISIPATPEDMDRLVSDPKTSQQVKDNILGWKSRIKKMNPNDRPLNFELKYAADGELVGLKDTYTVSPTKVNVSVNAGAGGSKDPFTEDEYARFYNAGQKTEYLPRRVQGSARANQAERSQWDKGYREWLASKGITGAEAGLAGADSRAEAKALDGIVKQENAIGGFEKGAKNAMGIAFDLSKKLKRGEVPKFNSWSQAIKQGLGDPEIKPFRNAVVTAMTEYMKVVTAGTNISSAELSVAAQERAKELLDKSDSHATFVEQMKIFEKEMKGKMKGIADQKAQLQKSRDKVPKTSVGPKTIEELNKTYMRTYPDTSMGKIKESSAYKADKARFNL